MTTLVLAHGAGAGSNHPWMKKVAAGLAERGVQVVLFDFAYVAAGRSVPDKAPVLEATWREVWKGLMDRPPGPFAGEALLCLVGPEPEQTLVPYPTVVDCFDAVRSGAVPEALVPIENSIEGSVNQTLDYLAAGAGDVVIRAAIVHPVRHHLVARPGLALADVRRILSHPHAPPGIRSALVNCPVTTPVSGSTVKYTHSWSCVGRGTSTSTTKKYAPGRNTALDAPSWHENL